MENTHMRAHEAPRQPVDWGIIHPIAPNLFQWPYAKMGIGDCFWVDQEDRPTQAIRGYAGKEGQRLRAKFSVSDEGELTKVTRVPPDELVSERHAAAAAARLTGGDGDKYLGVLEPPEQGNWTWPFRLMEPGQYFHVRHEDKHPEQARTLAYARGTQMAKLFAVTGNDPEMRGHCRIAYAEGARDTSHEAVADWAGVQQIVSRCYGQSIEDADFWGVSEHPRRVIELEMEQIAAPRCEKIIMTLDFVTIGFEFLKDRVRVHGLPKGASMGQWNSGKLVEPAPVPCFAAETPLTGIFAAIADDIDKGLKKQALTFRAEDLFSSKLDEQDIDPMSQ